MRLDYPIRERPAVVPQAAPQLALAFPGVAPGVLEPVPTFYPAGEMEYAFLYRQIQQTAALGTANAFTARQTITADSPGETAGALKISITDSVDPILDGTNIRPAGLVLEHRNTFPPTGGIGVSTFYNTLDSAGVVVRIGKEAAEITDGTPGACKSSMAWCVQKSGTEVEVFRIRGGPGMAPTYIAGGSTAEGGAASGKVGGQLFIRGDLLATGWNEFLGVPPANGNRALVEIGDGGFAGPGGDNFAGFSGGTYLAINAPAAITAGGLLDIQVGGVRRLFLGGGGSLTLFGSFIAQGALNTFSGAPQAQAALASVMIGDGGFGGLAGHFAGNSAGTYIGVNAPAATHVLLDLQVAGVSMARIGAAGSLTLDGSFINHGSLNQLASVAAPQAQAGLAAVMLGNGGFAGGAGQFSGSSGGTLLGLNAASGYAGNLVDYQVNGVSYLTLSAAGALAHKGSAAGWYGTAPVTKPTVTGSRGSNAALASLLTALASQGLLTDSTS